MNLRNAATVYRKELLDMVRDRRTMISSTVIPILLFPLLVVGMGSMAARLVERAQQETLRVAVLGEEHAPELAAALRQGEGLEGNGKLEVVPAPENYVQLINEKKLRAAVEFPANFERRLLAQNGELPEIKIYSYAGEMRSAFAVRNVQRIIREYRDRVVENRLSASGLSAAVLTPFRMTEENVATPEKVGGNVLGGLLPYMIILLCMTGALYPAIDLTAGEKERGTLETILASPVARSELVLGKFFLVLSFSLMTAVLALSSFAITLSRATSFVERISRDGATFSISLKAVAAVFFMVLPLAVLFSATLLAIALLAKSFKEAQSYLQPLVIVVILPAVAAMLPGVELNPKLALVPILNVSLVAKEIFTGTYPWDLIGIIFGSTCVYAAAALFVAVRQFHREEVLFRS